MLFSTVQEWLAGMNSQGYAGGTTWTLPEESDILTLAADMKLQPGDQQLMANGSIGPFQYLQPFFYWACVPAQTGSGQPPCDYATNIGVVLHTPMEWSFNFDTGFEGTDLASKEFFVEVYYPAP